MNTYPTWDSAVKSAGSYEDSRLNDFRCARMSDETTRGLAQSSGLLSVLGRLDIANPHVVDFGGATGDLGVDLLRMYPKAHFTVVETPSLIQRVRKKRPQIDFCETLPNDCDIFYTSGTLQYLSDPASVISSGFKIARHAVIFARNSFSPIEIIRVQQSRLFDNGRGDIPEGFGNDWIYYPHRTIKPQWIKTAAKEHGFRLVEKSRDRSGILPYWGLVRGGWLVFMRN